MQELGKLLGLGTSSPPALQSPQDTTVHCHTPGDDPKSL